MENNKDEAALSEAVSAGGEGCHSRNPISNCNPNPIPIPIPNPNPNTPRTTKGSKGKACRGVSFYSSVHKDKSQNPTCIGFSKTLQQVPPYVLGYTEMELDNSKAGRSLTNFKHFCIGYSLYLDNKDSSAGSQDKTAKLPSCNFGFELLFPGTAATSTVGQFPADARKTEEREHAAPQPQPQGNKPPTITAEAATSETASAGGEGCHPNPVSNNNPNPIPNPNPNTPRTTKGKACRGVAYYTSVHKDKSKNPTCIGLSKTLQQVPPYVLGYTKTELEALKEGRSLTNFKHFCIGCSAYLDNKDSSAGSQDKTAKLPSCNFGFEMLFTKKKENVFQKLNEAITATSTIGQVPADARKSKTEEREHAAPQAQRNKPPTITEDQFFNRFQKSAGLVATGVVKNLNRVGSYVKETIDDILSRRPK